ncbi:GL10847 [Drosophila persimilis]|uniref:Uncharacterized protein n=2 Tax=pseudoobscura subgroup TaxID=32358 RepID=A0A6I8V3T0_DROPS|nr:uncharacterized protein LOC6590490 [Drosophila persimilis]XP_002138238.1 uncharacterized protein LOC6898160 [Drosophila pseudoobscura]EDW31649.1 GL10847 [Drosophila persimilis]
MLTKVLGMRLNTYGVVVGWLGAIWSFLAVILISTALGFADEISEEIAKNSQDPNMTAIQIRTLLVIVLSVFLALKVINLLSSALLVMGTVKERHLLLLPWLINSGITLAFTIISTVLLWVEAIGSSPVAEALSVVFVSGGLVVLWWYLYYGIYSLFKHIQLTSDQQRPLIQGPPQRSGDHSGATYPNYTKI